MFYYYASTKEVLDMYGWFLLVAWAFGVLGSYDNVPSEVRPWFYALAAVCLVASIVFGVMEKSAETKIRLKQIEMGRDNE